MHAGADRRDAGRKLIGFQVGVRESAAELARTPRRGEKPGTIPEIAVDDGALGFWKALDELFRATRLSNAGCTMPQIS